MRQLVAKMSTALDADGLLPHQSFEGLALVETALPITSAERFSQLVAFFVLLSERPTLSTERTTVIRPSRSQP
jgi:hypothetical protein